MKTSTEQRIANAIKWLDAMLVKSGYKKTVQMLGEKNSGCKEVKDPKNDMSYCCLGVGCRVMNYTDVEFSSEFHDGLENDMGLFNSRGSFKDNQEFTIQGHKYISSLDTLNDDAYHDDVDFRNIRKFILSHLDLVFVPAVAKGLKKHYKK